MGEASYQNVLYVTKPLVLHSNQPTPEPDFPGPFQPAIPATLSSRLAVEHLPHDGGDRRLVAGPGDHRFSAQGHACRGEQADAHASTGACDGEFCRPLPQEAIDGSFPGDQPGSRFLYDVADLRGCGRAVARIRGRLHNGHCLDGGLLRKAGLLLGALRQGRTVKCSSSGLGDDDGEQYARAPPGRHFDLRRRI